MKVHKVFNPILTNAVGENIPNRFILDNDKNLKSQNIHIKCIKSLRADNRQIALQETFYCLMNVSHSAKYQWLMRVYKDAPYISPLMECHNGAKCSLTKVL